MKRIKIYALLAVFVFILAACGGNDQNGNDTNTTNINSNEATIETQTVSGPYVLNASGLDEEHLSKENIKNIEKTGLSYLIIADEKIEMHFAGKAFNGIIKDNEITITDASFTGKWSADSIIMNIFDEVYRFGKVTDEEFNIMLNTSINETVDKNNMIEQNIVIFDTGKVSLEMQGYCITDTGVDVYVKARNHTKDEQIFQAYDFKVNEVSSNASWAQKVDARNFKECIIHIDSEKPDQDGLYEINAMFNVYTKDEQSEDGMVNERISFEINGK